MLDIFGRLYCIARSRLPRSGDLFGNFVRGDNSRFDDSADDTRFSMGEDSDPAGGDDFQDGTYSHDFEVPERVKEDLAVFQLTPPSSLQEVRAVRNREIKKYHSDKFISDPEKLKLSKEIMQIYNASYDRLKAFYENR